MGEKFAELELSAPIGRGASLEIVYPDETPVRYLDPGNGKTRRGYLWVFHAPGKGVYIQWYPSRKAECLQDILNEFDGTIQNAIILTVLQNCKVLGINPEEYLTDVLSRLPDLTNHQACELTPAKWLAARQTHSMTG